MDRNVHAEGFSGFSTEGPNRYYFSSALPRKDSRAKANDLFNNEVLKLANEVRYSPELRTKENIKALSDSLLSRGYLDPENIYSGYNHYIEGAANRYINNFNNHPDNTIQQDKLIEFFKNLF